MAGAEIGRTGKVRIADLPGEGKEGGELFTALPAGHFVQLVKTLTHLIGEPRNHFGGRGALWQSEKVTCP